MQRFYVTTPIYYANGRPHLGNTYTTTLCDSLTRFYQYLGYETFFLTGTDEHGDKVHQAAVAAGKTPLEFTDEVSELFKRTWQDFDLRFDRFIRTTDADHKAVVSQILSRIHKKGDIYFGEYGGLYCVGCERFLTEKELVDGKCPDHQTTPQFLKEKNYFFKMAKYQQQLIDHITNVAPDFIRPERYKNEVLAMLREPLEDLCISRPKSRLTWGIELPFDSNYVTYVWFDALINYISGVGYPDGANFKKFWPVAEHMIAKDIVKPHGVFWPIMLFAADIPLFKHLNVHGYWVTPTGKMSKTVGNVVDPAEIKRRFGMDTYRYYVFREMAFGLDGAFSGESLEARYNADLANNLGNLVSRSLAMVHKYRGGIVPKPGTHGELESKLQSDAQAALADVTTLIKGMEIHKALERIWTLIDSANVYIDRTKPWSLDKAGAVDALDTALYTLCEILRIIAGLLSAFLPETSQKILSFLGFKGKALAAEQTVLSSSTWGRMKPGVNLQKGESLFPRTDTVPQETASMTTEKQPEQTTTAKDAAANGSITYDEFSKVDLRVGQIIQAERIAKSDKLVKVQVDLGEKLGTRQIVAGIAKHYEPNDLVGRKIAVVTNLKPTKLMGEVSEGMLLAASDDEGHLELVSPGLVVPSGSKIK